MCAVLCLAAGRDSDGTTVFVKGFDRYIGDEDAVGLPLLPLP